jgi:hypothetical protein
LEPRIIFQYTRPLHPDVVLFTEDPAIIKMIIAEPPAECRKCRKLYYKHECDVREARK